MSFQTLPQPTMNESSHPSTAPGHPPTRLQKFPNDLARRRHQNRESQRTFRERQRKIKQDQRQESINEGSARQVLRRAIQPKTTALGLSNTSNLEAQIVGSQEFVAGTDNAQDFSQTLPTEPGNTTESWFSDADLDTILFDNFPITQRLDIAGQISHSTATFGTPSSSQLVTTSQSFHSPPIFEAATSAMSGQLLPEYLVDQVDHPTAYTTYISANAEQVMESTGALSLLQVSNTAEHRHLLENALNQHHSMGSIFLAGLQSISKSMQSAQHLPDMYSNHLSLRKLSTLQAYLANANALLFDVPSLMNPFSPSPFHQRDIATVAAADVYISTLPDALPLHLRPTSAQILHAHLPFLDLLPFPTLRERAITLASVTPPLIDLRELKVDILNDGLVCWGGNNRGGQPWDMRTWEAARWFLRKWWILVGGESDEVREGARWWRRLRGEEETRFYEEI